MQIAIYESLKAFMHKIGFLQTHEATADEPIWSTRHENAFRSMMEYVFGVAPSQIRVPMKLEELHPGMVSHPEFEAPVVDSVVAAPAAAVAVEAVSAPAPAPAPVVEAPAPTPAPTEAPAPAPAPAAPEVVEAIKQEFDASQQEQAAPAADATAAAAVTAPSDAPAAAVDTPAQQPAAPEQQAAQEGSAAQE